MSALTYCRRGSLMAACGIAPEDDDGNASVGQKYNKENCGDYETLKFKIENADSLVDLQKVWSELNPDERLMLGVIKDLAKAKLK